MVTITKAEKLFTKISDLGEQRDDLMRELAASCELERLWPEAFNVGKVKVQRVGNSLVIKRRDGAERSFSPVSLPDGLLRRHFPDVARSLRKKALCTICDKLVRETSYSYINKMCDPCYAMNKEVHE